MAALERGAPGWVGRSVAIQGFDDAHQPTTLARVWLGEDGHIQSDNKAMLKRWQDEGIVGRGDQGRLFPKNGQAFLDELPFVYKSAYFRAEPVRRLDR